MENNRHMFGFNINELLGTIQCFQQVFLINGKINAANVVFNEDQVISIFNIIEPGDAFNATFLSLIYLHSYVYWIADILDNDPADNPESRLCTFNEAKWRTAT